MTDQELTHLLTSSHRIAVVGVSNKPDRDSHMVAMYLVRAGYEVLPVNPLLTEWEGRPCWPDLASVPGPIDIVDIFRRPEQVPAIVREAIAVGARAVWMQFGTWNEEAAIAAREAGLQVVEDRCIKVEHRSLLT